MEILVPERVSGSMSLPGSPSASSPLRPVLLSFCGAAGAPGVPGGAVDPCCGAPRCRPLSTTTSLVRRDLPAQRPPRWCQPCPARRIIRIGSIAMLIARAIALPSSVQSPEIDSI